MGLILSSTRHKFGRATIVTTHHLDEAEILSDRVAIVHSVSFEHELEN